MMIGVILGAFGSHMLKDKISAYHLDIFKTGVFYQFIHALALFVVAWLSTQSTDPKIHIAGFAFILGICLFSGSLYILANTSVKGVGLLTPLGGLSFIIGWLLLIISK